MRFLFENIHLINKKNFYIATTAALEGEKKKNILLNRVLEPLLSPSPGMHSVLDPVEPPRIVNDLKTLIARYILSIICVSTLITNPPLVYSG